MPGRHIARRLRGHRPGRDPEHEDHDEAKLWLSDYDPNEIDELPMKYALSRIANQRNAAKARLAKKKPESTS